MPEHPETDEFIKLEGALKDLFHRSNPDPRFVKQLSQQLSTRGPAIRHTDIRKPSIFQRLGITWNTLAWGAAIIAMVLIMIWAFNRLIPRAVPGALSSAAPESLSTPATTYNLPTQNGITAEAEVKTNPLTLQSPPDEISQRMLLSHTLWHSLWADGIISYYPTDGSAESPQSSRTQIWITQPAQARILSGVPDGTPNYLWISDGEKLRNGEEVPLFIRQWEDNAQEKVPGIIYPHPLTGFLPTPLVELLFPTGLAQREGTFRPINLETIAGRQALVVEWLLPDGKLVDRFWIDAQTGVILRQQNYGKEGNGLLTTEIALTDIVYDADFPPGTFDRLAAFPSAFASNPGEIHAASPATPLPAGNPTDTVPDSRDTISSPEAGEIYLLLYKDGYTSAGMARFPAACLLDGRPCPPAELITGFPNDEIGEWPLRWSPDGQQLIIPSYGISEQVLIFDRQSQTWRALETPFFSGALWSPDGNWLVGQPIIHGDTTSNPLLLARADGREWRYLLQDVEGFKSPLGWLDENQIVFIQTLDNVEPSFHAEIQVLDVDSGALTLLQDIFYEEGLNGPVLKPDGSQLAYAVDRSDPYRINLVDIPSGKVTTLDAPIAGSLDWSPDGRWLAITAALGYSCEIHVLQIGDQEAHKIFTGDWGGACIYTWSPDGTYILVGAYAQNPTVPRLYVVSIPDGETRLIELPDIGVEFEWPRPSWVP